MSHCRNWSLGRHHKRMVPPKARWSCGLRTLLRLSLRALLLLLVLVWLSWDRRKRKGGPVWGHVGVCILRSIGHG